MSLSINIISIIVLSIGINPGNSDIKILIFYCIQRIDNSDDTKIKKSGMHIM